MVIDLASQKKAENELVEKVTEKEDVIIFRAKKKLTNDEHKQLSEKVRFENEKTGLKIVLMPSSCEVGDE